MCLVNFAKQINIFNRDYAEITKADVIATYITIISSIWILVWYSYKYYELSNSYIDKCEKTQDSTSCFKTDFTHYIVPYIGILYGFFMTFYKICNIFAILLNYLCCCCNCCSSKQNPNEITVNREKIDIELNNVVKC